MAHPRTTIRQCSGSVRQQNKVLPMRSMNWDGSIRKEGAHGVSQDYGQAAQWFRKAADGREYPQCTEGAQRATLRRGGIGAALFAWSRYTECAVGWARYELGVLYEQGQGVPRSKVVAHALYSLGANSAGSYSCSDNERKLKNSMTAQEIKASEALSDKIRNDGFKVLDDYLAASAR
jgi:hypothetical protein